MLLMLKPHMYSPYYKPHYGWLYRILIPLSSQLASQLASQSISIPTSIPFSTAYILFLVGGLEHFLFSQKYWVANHPNWLSYFSEWWPNHQPDLAYTMPSCSERLHPSDDVEGDFFWGSHPVRFGSQDRGFSQMSIWIYVSVLGERMSRLLINVNQC